VVAVSASARHGFAKHPQPSIELMAGRGVAGDAHCGVTVQHIFDKKRDPSRPNLRQVHLIEARLLQEIRDRGFVVSPGDLGENIVVEGIDLVALSAMSRLRIGAAAVLQLSGLREPCVKIERFAKGLRAELTEHHGRTRVTRRSVMAIVVASGAISPGDLVTIEEPETVTPLQLV
jgi:MOSC domain-containing protein YiiM